MLTWCASDTMCLLYSRLQTLEAYVHKHDSLNSKLNLILDFHYVANVAIISYISYEYIIVTATGQI